MNTTLQIILAEAFIIFLILVVGFVAHHWRRSKKKQSALEELLDQVSASETVRKEKLISYLVENHQLDNNKSAELCEDFIEAEKRFMFEFIQQQLQQVPVTGCYENVCRLLDHYLQLLTTTSSITNGKELGTIPVEEADTESQESAEQIEDDSSEEQVSSEQEEHDEFAEESIENQEAFDTTTVPAIEMTAEEELDEFTEDIIEIQKTADSIKASETENITEEDEFS